MQCSPPRSPPYWSLSSGSRGDLEFTDLVPQMNSMDRPLGFAVWSRRKCRTAQAPPRSIGHADIDVRALPLSPGDGDILTDENALESGDTPPSSHQGDPSTPQHNAIDPISVSAVAQGPLMTSGTSARCNSQDNLLNSPMMLDKLRTANNKWQLHGSVSVQRPKLNF